MRGSDTGRSLSWRCLLGAHPHAPAVARGSASERGHGLALSVSVSESPGLPPGLSARSPSAAAKDRADWTEMGWDARGFRAILSGSRVPTARWHRRLAG